MNNANSPRAHGRAIRNSRGQVVVWCHMHSSISQSSDQDPAKVIL